MHYPREEGGQEPGFIEAVLKALSDIKDKREEVVEDCQICMNNILNDDGKAAEHLIALGEKRLDEAGAAYFIVWIYCAEAFERHLQTKAENVTDPQELTDLFRVPIADRYVLFMPVHDGSDDPRDSISFAWMALLRGLIQLPPNRQIGTQGTKDFLHPLWEQAIEHVEGIQYAGPSSTKMRTLLHTTKPQEGIVDFIFGLAEVAWLGTYLPETIQGEGVRQILRRQHDMLAALLKESVFLKKIRH